MQILFLHGLESGPFGSKYRALCESGWEVVAPDCTGVMDVFERVRRAHEALEACEGPVVVVGSSFGGLTACLLERTEKVVGYVLCAPALHREEAAQIASAPKNARIVHGTLDEVVPVECSREYALKHGFPLTETEDGHRLSKSKTEILEAVKVVAS